jgi:copper chaperone CopZ
MDSNCHVVPVRKLTPPAERNNLTTVSLTIWGMGCPNCANRVRNSLLALNGVVEAEVNHTTGFACVEYNQALVSESSLLQAVSQAGSDGRHNYLARLFEDGSL